MSTHAEPDPTPLIPTFPWQRTLPVAEVFGPVTQGEGPHTGRRCSFLRLGLCNLSCEWCDTPFTWDRARYNLAEECPETSMRDIADQLEATDTRLTILSGGEPLIHHRTLPALFATVPQREWHAETNGTITPPAWWTDHITHTSISPKINTNDPEHRRIRSHVLARWADLAATGHACFKFVATSHRDLDAIEALALRIGLEPSWVWVMPEGTDPDTLLTRHRLLDAAITGRGWNTSTRLHVLLHGNERGH